MAMNGDQGFVGFRGGNGVGMGMGRGNARGFDPKDDACGFLNFYLPGAKGPEKVGRGVALRVGYAKEAKLNEQLQAAYEAQEAGNPEPMKELVQLLLENLEIRYWPAKGEEQESEGFVLKRKTQP